MPAVIVVVALGKLIGALKVLAEALALLFGIESFAGRLVLDLLALTVTVLLCCGIAGQRSERKAHAGSWTGNSFPGYAFIKGFADNLRHTEELAGSFVPVVVQFDDYVQVAFEAHRDDGKVAVYLPGAPNPWSGTVVYVSTERVKRLPITLPEALRNIRTLGKGSIDTAG